MSIDNYNDPLSVFRGLNFVDSSIFGINFDIFKVSLFIGAGQSGILKNIGLSDVFDPIVFHFLYPSDFSIEVNNSSFAYSVVDDELAGSSMAQFESDPQISLVGNYKKDFEKFNLSMKFTGGSLNFNFIELKLEKFEIDNLAISGLSIYADRA